MKTIKQQSTRMAKLQPQFLEKLHYKLRYNSWPRLLVNALKRFGITILPYYVFYRDITGSPKQPDLDGYEFVELTAVDMPLIAALPLAHSHEQTYQLRLQNKQRCYALRQQDEIFAFCWMDPDHFSFKGEGKTLQADEAYIYDIYTLPIKRGHHLAPKLNACYTNKLRAEGIRTVIGVVDTMNQPSLNYVRKIGCQVQQKKLYLNIFGLINKSIVLEVFTDKSSTQPAEKQDSIT
jgi:hypothetical protein